MINGSFMNDQAQALAARLRREAGPDAPAQVALALRLATGREPTAAEVDRGVGLILGLRKENDSAETALDTFCLVVLNLDEFIYLD